MWYLFNKPYMWNDSIFKNHLSSIMNKKLRPWYLYNFHLPPIGEISAMRLCEWQISVRCAWYLFKYQTEVQIWKVWNFVLCPKSHFQHPALERPILPAGLFAKQSKSKETCERLNNFYFLFLFHVFCMILWYFSSEFGAQSKF